MQHCDVLIIRGDYRCTIAYYASKYGRDVSILEKGEVDRGTLST